MENSQETHSSGLIYFMPEWIFSHPDLSNTEKLIYALLSGLAHGNEEKICFPSDEYIAKRLGIKKNAANESVAQLAKIGAISKVVEPHEKNPFRKKRIITVYLHPQKFLTNTEKTVSRYAKKTVSPDTEKTVSHIVRNKAYRKKEKVKKESAPQSGASVLTDASLALFPQYKNIKMTEEQWNHLKEQYSEKNLHDVMFELQNYSEATPDKFRKYQSHPAVIRSWLKRKGIVPYEPIKVTSVEGKKDDTKEWMKQHVPEKYIKSGKIKVFSLSRELVFNFNDRKELVSWNNRDMILHYVRKLEERNANS